MAEETFVRNHKKFTDRLWALKTKTKFCDTTITVDGEKIDVHAVVLTTKKINNKDSKSIDLTDFNKDVVQSLIEYCYKGSTNIAENDVVKLLRLADFLSMPKIVKSCTKIVKKMLNAENSTAMLKTVKLEKTESLKQTILKFIRKNIKTVIATPKFSDLDRSDLTDILRSNDMPAMVAYNAVKKWLAHDSSRAENIVDLLECIKLECLPREFLLSESQSICKLSAPCLLKFISAIKSRFDTMPFNCSNSNTLIAVGRSRIFVSKFLEIFDQIKREWVEIGYESNKTSFSMVLVSDKLMIIGGKSNGNILNTAEYYDLKTGQIESLPSMKYKRYKFSATTFGGHVYVFGGNYKSALGYVEKWDPSTKKWNELSPMKLARYAFAVAVFRNEIFAIGGAKTFEVIYSEVEAYNPKTNTWRTCGSLNVKRKYHGVATIGDYVYVVGGKNNDYLNSVERYDSQIDKWSFVQQMPTVRFGPGAVNLNEHLIVAGGWSGKKYENTVEVYDEENNQWKWMPPMNKPRYAFNLISLPWSLAESVLARKSKN